MTMTARRKEIIFWVVGSLIFLAVAGYAIYAISFIASKADQAFSANLKNRPEAVKFNLEKARELR